MPASCGSGAKPALDPMGTEVVTGRQAVASKAAQARAAKRAKNMAVPLWAGPFWHKRGGMTQFALGFGAGPRGFYTWPSLNRS